MNCEMAHLKISIIKERYFSGMEANQSPSDGLTTGRRLANGLLLIGVGTLVYFNGFEGSFVFDDLLYLNTKQQSLWQAMFTGDNASRPLIGFTLYLNYAISGHDDWSYHLLNLLVHLLASLCLYGIVRRTLLSDKLRQRFGKRSANLALVIALLWMVHPLQTQSVTYMIQRCESVMGLFYLLTLYCVIRSFDSGRKTVWYVCAIGACIGGMLSKQVMVTAPVMVLLYDAMFESGSLNKALRKGWRLYVGLAATWAALFVTLVISPTNPTAGFAVKAISPLAYFLSEFKVLAHYLKLAFYPVDLSIDYGWKQASGLGEIVPYAIPILVLQVATLWGLYRGKALAFLGGWFFGIIAVTSSLMPFSDLVFEHRMYLSLAAVVTLVVLSADWAMRRLAEPLTDDPAGSKRWVKSVALAMITLLVTGLGLLTMRRNMDYKTPFVLWTDTVNKQPACGRAQINLGKLLLEQGLDEQAIVCFTEGLKYEPKSLEGHNNMGLALLNLGQLEKAKEHLLTAASQRPDAVVHYNLGRVFLKLGEIDNAVEQLSKSVELRSDSPNSHQFLGVALAKQGRFEEALGSFNDALRIDATDVETLNEKALLLMSRENSTVSNPQEAMVCAMQAVAISKKRYGKSLDVLGQVYAAAGRYAEAIEVAQQATLSILARQDKEFAQASAARLKSYQEKAKSKTAKS
jgi:protein O-mannosyl-transferase